LLAWDIRPAAYNRHDYTPAPARRQHRGQPTGHQLAPIMKIDFGLHFFPDTTPAEKSPVDTYRDFLRIVDLVDELGYATVRMVEHYFEPYGGYSPNPLLFLAAASQRTKLARLVPGALLPVFNNPLKLAGEIAMLDAITIGRMDIAFARAFLPHEFERFGIDIDESRARFDEGVAAVLQLLTKENTSFEGRFVRFRNVTSLPRPTQQPRPPVWVAVLATPHSFESAGRNGFWLMANPLGGERMAALIALYRKAWRDAGHPGNGRVMISFRMLCLPDGDEARRVFRDPVTAHQRALLAAATVTEGWGTGKRAKDYAGYEQIIGHLRSETYESNIEKGSTWVGSPAEVRTQIERIWTQSGGFEIASVNGLSHLLSPDIAERSLRTFAREVMPAFR